MIRLIANQSKQIKRTKVIEFTFDDQKILAHEGETVLAALMRNGIKYLRDAPVDGTPRGAFCCMGLCQECVVRIDGKYVESCRLMVSRDLFVQSLKCWKND